jgi:hypothetical protein
MYNTCICSHADHMCLNMKVWQAEQHRTCAGGQGKMRHVSGSRDSDASNISAGSLRHASRDPPAILAIRELDCMYKLCCSSTGIVPFCFAQSVTVYVCRGTRVPGGMSSVEPVKDVKTKACKQLWNMSILQGLKELNPFQAHVGYSHTQNWFLCLQLLPLPAQTPLH